VSRALKRVEEGDARPMPPPGGEAVLMKAQVNLTGYLEGIIAMASSQPYELDRCLASVKANAQAPSTAASDIADTSAKLQQPPLWQAAARFAALAVPAAFLAFCSEVNIRMPFSPHVPHWEVLVHDYITA